MCNEYYWKKVHGEWVWTRGRRPDGYRGPKDVLPEPDMFAMFPDREQGVIWTNKDGAPEWQEMRWGFPPPTAAARPVTNVRNTQSSFWRGWLDPKWRVVVPFNLFVEFTDQTPKQKHFFSVTDNEPIAFAGIWRPWTGTRGTKANPVEGEHKLFAILTTEANDLVRPIHAKAMPVLLSGEEQQKAWLTMSVEEALAVQRNVFQPERMRVA